MKKKAAVPHPVWVRDGCNFIVTTHTGYRAVLPECWCEREPCPLKTCKDRSHCHGAFGLRHEAHVRKFCLEVHKTYRT